MPIPLDLTSAVAKLSIVGLPTLATAGVTLRPRLEPSLESVVAPLLERIALGDLDLDILLDNGVAGVLDHLGVDLAALLSLDFASVEKQVEFGTIDNTAAQIDPSQPIKQKLAHVIPTNNAIPPLLGSSPDVAGAIGRSTGTDQGTLKGAATPVLKDLTKLFEQTSVRRAVPIPTDMAHSLIGKLRGALSKPPLVGFLPRIRVEWSLRDSAGTEIGTDPTQSQTAIALVEPNAPAPLPPQLPGLTVTLNGKVLKEISPLLCVYPIFEELSVDGPSLERFTLACRIVIEEPPPPGSPPGTPPIDTKTVDLGPFELPVPRVGIPTVACMTEHAFSGANEPGGVLLAVLHRSALASAETLLATVSALRSTLSAIDSTLTLLSAVPLASPFGPLATALGAVATLFDFVPNPRMVVADDLERVMDLFYVPFREARWFGDPLYRGWNDMISSVILLGPPSRKVRLHVLPNTWWKDGVLGLAVSPVCVAWIQNLRDLDTAYPQATPKALPTQDRVATEYNLPSYEPNDFNDKLSSLQFLTTSSNPDRARRSAIRDPVGRTEILAHTLRRRWWLATRRPH